MTYPDRLRATIDILKTLAPAASGTALVDAAVALLALSGRERKTPKAKRAPKLAAEPQD